MTRFQPDSPVTAQVRALGLPLHLPGSSCMVYRFRDDEGSLLYVGVTSAPANRWTAHNRRAAWWPQVAEVSWEIHDHKPLAEEEERRIIAAQRPRYNVRSARIPQSVAESARNQSRNERGGIPQGNGREGNGREVGNACIVSTGSGRPGFDFRDRPLRARRCMPGDSR